MSDIPPEPAPEPPEEPVHPIPMPEEFLPTTPMYKLSGYIESGQVFWMVDNAS